MIPVPAAFLTAVRGSHQIVSRARLVEPGQTGTNLPGRDLKIVSGSVNLDASADIRGTMTLEVAEVWASGTGTMDLLPYGTEIQVSRGIVLGGGSVLRCPLGIYRIIDVEQNDAPFNSITLTCRDRMSYVQEAELLQPSYLLPTMTYGQALTRFIVGDGTLAGIYPNAQIVWDDISAVTGRDKPLGFIRSVPLVVEQDRYQFLADLMKSLGKIWYWDYAGRLQIKTPVTGQQVPITSVNAGKNGVLVKADRSVSRTGACSAVVVTGEAFDAIRPPRGVAYDLNPLSPTYFNGPFGQVPLFFTDPAVESDAQAVIAANALLSQKKGLPYNVNFNMVPNPALEPLDVVEVVYPVDLRSDPHVRREFHVLEQVEIGLGADEDMYGKTRLSVTVV